MAQRAAKKGNAPKVLSNHDWAGPKLFFCFALKQKLLIENRQPKGLDALLPQGGLAIFKVDTSAGYNDEGK